MPSTLFAFKESDTNAIIEALGSSIGYIWHLGDMTVLSRSGAAALKVEALVAAGLSFNYASYNVKSSMSPAVSGQIRYGHDGTSMFSPLVPDLQLSAIYNKFLPGEERLDDTERFRICHVCCGQESWDNREENGQMHKLRNLLSE